MRPGDWKGSEPVIIESGELVWGTLVVLLVAEIVFWVLSFGGVASEETRFRLVAAAVVTAFPLLAFVIQAVAPLFQMDVSMRLAWGAAASVWAVLLWACGIIFGGRPSRADG